MWKLINEEDRDLWIEWDYTFDTYGEAVKEMKETGPVHCIITNGSEYYEFFKQEDDRYFRV